MSDHLKLTDEVLDRAALVLNRASNMHKDTDAFIAAIRALRDAARAVCDAAKLADSRLSINGWDAIRDLRDLLPDEPKGGG